MSDVSKGPGWWQASDGQWYPPADDAQAPGDGWWLASDGQWYPPADDAQAPGDGWWLASDGNWYPPADDATAPSTPPAPSTSEPAPTLPTTKASAGAGRAPLTPTNSGSRPAPVSAPPLGSPASPATRSASPTPQAEPAVDLPPSKDGPAEPVPAEPVAAKPVPTKPVAAKPVPAKPVAAKPVPAKPVPAKPVAAKPVPAKPVPAKPVPAKPVAPGAAKGGQASGAAPRQPAAATADPAASGTSAQVQPKIDDADEIRRPSWGLSADQQIAIRNQSSRADARVQAAARFAAANRALKALEAEGASEHSETDELPTQKSPIPGPTTTAPTASTASSDKIGPAPSATKSSPDSVGPLLEVKPPPLSADAGHIGERLVIFGDRVELHDRSDNVRQVIMGDDIVDVVVHKRFTGATITVESIDGSSIVAKGLSPDKAEKVREIIQRRTRQTAPVSPDRPRPSRVEDTAPSGTPVAETATPAIDTADLLSKLDALHQAGVLTDAELAAKKSLVERLGDGRPVAATGRP